MKCGSTVSYFLVTGRAPVEPLAAAAQQGDDALTDVSGDLGAVIHTDFERGFIKAEVINWEVLLGHGSEAAAKAQGALRIEGKEYVVKDGDVMHFLFNV